MRWKHIELDHGWQFSFLKVLIPVKYLSISSSSSSSFSIDSLFLSSKSSLLALHSILLLVSSTLSNKDPLCTSPSFLSLIKSENWDIFPSVFSSSSSRDSSSKMSWISFVPSFSCRDLNQKFKVEQIIVYLSR